MTWTIIDEIKHRAWKLNQRIKEQACLLLDHNWKSYQETRWKTCRDGIMRQRVYIKFRCARCSLEESTYQQQDVPRTLADELRGLKCNIYDALARFRKSKNRAQIKEPSDDELPF